MTFGFAPNFYDYPGYYYDDCYQLRRVWTDFGWRYVRVDVCDDDY